MNAVRRLAAALVLSAAASTGTAWSQSPDFSRLVVVGDSLSAGFQNGSLLADQQARGYASVVADAVGAALPLPAIAPPGIPNVLLLRNPCERDLEVAPGVSIGRLDPTQQALNLAVPGHDAVEALQLRPNLLFDDLTDLVLGLPGLLGGVAASQVEWAELLAPTTVFLWLGSNDVLGAALAADATLVTPTAAFEAAYGEAIDRLAATGATLVVANVPDVTVIPYLIPATELAAAAGLPFAVVGPALGLAPDDFVTPDALGFAAAVLGAGKRGPLRPGLVLDAGEVAAIRQAVQAYNAFIAAEAARHGAVLVDVFALLESIDAGGLDVAGTRITTDYLGGLFSIDGIHPSDTGNAIVADAFVEGINAQLGAALPRIDVAAVALADPLVVSCP